MSPLGMTVDLQGQIAIVTGASQGLGKTCAQRLADNGATVVCVARKADKLATTIAEIEAAGGQAVAMPCDVCDRVAVKKLFSDVHDKYGKLDILLNNAGITRDTLLPRMTDQQWDDVIQTNLTSCFLCCRAASLTS